jgi:hypothetical protein
MWVGGQRHAPGALPSGRRNTTHYTIGWVGPRSVWTGAENRVRTEILSPDRPARSKSLYLLCAKMGVLLLCA